MKSLRSIFTLFCLLLVHSLAEAVVECDKPNDPEQVRIYFANGMNNESWDILASKDALQDLVVLTSDRSFGISENTKETFFRQLLEVYSQKESESSQFWLWLADMSLAPQWFQDAVIAAQTTLVNNVSYALDKDLRIMINEYLQDLNSGKKVVIVSHSQGNFYANEAESLHSGQLKI